MGGTHSSYSSSASDMAAGRGHLESELSWGVRESRAHRKLQCVWVPPAVLPWPHRPPCRPIDLHSPTAIPLYSDGTPLPKTLAPPWSCPPPTSQPRRPPKSPPPLGSVPWAPPESRRPSPQPAFMWGGNPTPMTSFPPPPWGCQEPPPTFPRIVPQMPLNVTVTRNLQLSG